MKKIAIVEDNPDISEAIQLSLEDMYACIPILDGDRAFKTIKKECPDLVFLDILLGATDGKKICTSIKQDPKTKQIPVVLLSANNQLKKIFEESGAEDYLTKPFDVADIIAKAQKWIK